MLKFLFSRVGWMLPVLLAITTSTALGLGYLHLAQPNAVEPSTVRVVVSDEAGKAANTIRVFVSETLLVQKDTVSPGPEYTGTVHYPEPYLTKPNLKVISGKRRYLVTVETETGFTWYASPLPNDFHDDAKKDATALARFLSSGSFHFAKAQGQLKSDLIFEDFTWEAKGLRAPPSTHPPMTFAR